MEFLRDIYTKADPDFTGRVTVPVLWTRRPRRSSPTNPPNHPHAELGLRRVGRCLGRSLPRPSAPRDRRAQRPHLSLDHNGVYRSGFATTQHAYERRFDELFDALEELEERLAHNRYLVGDRLTEADWRLFTTLVRFDAVTTRTSSAI